MNRKLRREAQASTRVEKKRLDDFNIYFQVNVSCDIKESVPFARERFD